LLAATVGKFQICICAASSIDWSATDLFRESTDHTTTTIRLPNDTRCIQSDVCIMVFGPFKTILTQEVLSAFSDTEIPEINILA
jgi:hypothetical protein